MTEAVPALIRDVVPHPGAGRHGRDYHTAVLWFSTCRVPVDDWDGAWCFTREDRRLPVSPYHARRLQTLALRADHEARRAAA